MPGRAAGPGRARRGRPLRPLARRRGAPPGRLLGGASRSRRRRFRGPGFSPEGLAELLHQAVHAVCRERKGNGVILKSGSPSIRPPTVASLTTRHGSHGRAGNTGRGRPWVPLLVGAR